VGKRNDDNEMVSLLRARVTWVDEGGGGSDKTWQNVGTCEAPAHRSKSSDGRHEIVEYQVVGGPKEARNRVLT
jgi:hypothetical protein